MFRQIRPSVVRHTLVLYLNECICHQTLSARGMILVFFPGATAVTKFNEELPRRGLKYMWVGKICDFRRKSPFMSETVRDRLMVAMER